MIAPAVGVAVLTALALSARAGAQDPWQAFDAAVQRARKLEEGSPPARAAFATAVREFLKVPENVEGYRERLPAAGEAAFHAGQVELALELLAANAERGGETAASLRVRLQALARSGRLDELLALAKQEHSRFPRVVEAALRRHEGRLLPAADGLLQQQRPDLGLWLFETLASFGDGWRLANLALAYRKLGRVSDSEAAYRRALQVAPRDEQIWNDYGLFLRATGRWQEAVEAFWHSHGLEAEPGRGPAITNLVQMEWLRPGSVGRDPLPAAFRALALRPEAQMLRRLVLDLVLDRWSRPGPDKARAGR